MYRNAIQVTFDIPDSLAAQLQAAGRNPARAALEALAIEGYRAYQLTDSQVRRMLGFETRMEVHALLTEHQVPLQYDERHLLMDIQASDQLYKQRALRSRV